MCNNQKMIFDVHRPPRACTLTLFCLNFWVKHCLWKWCRKQDGPSTAAPAAIFCKLSVLNSELAVIFLPVAVDPTLAAFVSHRDTRHACIQNLCIHTPGGMRYASVPNIYGTVARRSCVIPVYTGLRGAACNTVDRTEIGVPPRAVWYGARPKFLAVALLPSRPPCSRRPVPPSGTLALSLLSLLDDRHDT